MRWWVKLIVFITFPVCIHGQIAINKLNFSVDYNNLSVPNFINSSDRVQYGLGMEVGINDVFSWEAYGLFDFDGYMPYRNVALGAGIGDFSKHAKWSSRNVLGYVGMRAYPIEQWSSSDLRIRYKDNKGFYVSGGYGVTMYSRRNFHLETWQSAIVDSSGVVNYSTDSVFMHTNSFNVLQRGMQFGFGYKLFQSPSMYTDVAVYTEAYMRDSRRVWGSYQRDPDGGIYFDDDLWQQALNSVEYWAKNGRGFIVKLSIGVNLDIKR